MTKPLLAAAALLLTGFSVVSQSPAAEPAGANDGFDIDAADWPWWRGPLRNGIASPDQTPPTHWSESKGVAWKTPVPGRGHGSPTVVGGYVYLATCDEAAGSQSVLCFDRKTGKQIWQQEVHSSGAMRKNSKSTAASTTLACDGERLFACFPNSGALYTTALGLDGKQLWQQKIGDYIVHQGYGSSPAIYQSLVIVTSDNKGGGAIAGLDRRTGRIVWKRDRPKTPNYPSPIILHAAGRDQLIMTGCDLVSSFDPLTGKTLWEIEGSTTECVTSTVTDGRRILTSGGYPTNHMSAVEADGSGKVAWSNKNRVYVPSMLLRDGIIYGVLDAGIASCWKSDTGEELWKERLDGNFSSSPVLVGDLIYATNEAGTTFVYRASPEGYSEVAQNRLGDEVFATPTICGSRIYMRVAQRGADGRQEFLCCLTGE
ncbi:PQQ-binding-like beta-propeller repeat protein [bacterium]|nr:PQQ-binding-like beta-propeller repeat protein [bacterium]